jgi:hypothetical protein
VSYVNLVVLIKLCELSLWNTGPINLWKLLVMSILFAFCNEMSMSTCAEILSFCDHSIFYSVTISYVVQ